VQQFTAGGRIWNHSFAAPLDGLRANPECTPRRIDVIAAETAQLLTAQSCIVRERQHDAVADRLMAGRGKNRVPIVLVRNPGQLVMPRNQRSACVTVRRGLLARTPPSIGYAWNNRMIVNYCCIVALESRESSAANWPDRDQPRHVRSISRKNGVVS
jgi:hypothetical protein